MKQKRNKEKIDKKRFVADIPVPIHTRIKTIASMKNESLVHYVMEAVVERLVKDEERL